MALRNISNSLKQPLFYDHLHQVNTNLKLKNKLSLSISSSSSCTSSEHETNSAQIRTSSPISTSSSSQTDLFAPFNPVVYTKKSKSKSPKKVTKHVSIRELAYEKLKKQQELEKIQQAKLQVQPQQTVSINNVRSYGKLKIAAYNNVGHLTIHIIKGRSYRTSNLKVKESTDTYVKLNMIPDLENRFHQCQTMLVKHNPQMNKQNALQQDTINYDEKFSFELNKQCDLNNRLVISVWSRHTMPHPNSLSSSASSISTSSSTSINNSHLIVNDELIGCFSFKIKNLIREPIQSTWYHLLSEQIGLNKHFRCHRPQQQHPTSSNQQTNKDYEDLKHITNLNKDLIGMERLRIQVARANELESYGFTITSNFPCMVGKVDTTKQAYSAGLRAGDYLSSINNKNVSRATCESVVKLIKSSRTNTLDIEVCREKKVINTVIAKPIHYVQPLIHLPPQQPLINKQSIPTYQFKPVQTMQHQMLHQPINNNQLEVVLEEDENVMSDNSFEEIDHQDNLVIKDEPIEHQLCCMNELDQIRHVDSSDLNSSIDELDNVEEMRRAAAKFYSNEHFTQQQFIRQANIMSLKNLKIC